MKTESKLVKSQYKNFEKDIMVGNKEGKIKITIRYDDECGNKHNSFEITGTIYSSRTSTLDKYNEAIIKMAKEAKGKLKDKDHKEIKKTKKTEQ